MYTTPFLDLPPLLRAGGTLRLPGSKSISNRVLLLAGFASGTTVVHDLLESDDTQVMLDAPTDLYEPAQSALRVRRPGVEK